MYLHKTKNGHYTPPCCYFSGELEVVECLPQTFSCGLMVYQRDELLKAMENSSRSYDEILAFITSENVPEDEEKQG